MFRARHGLGLSALLLWSLAGPSLHAQSSAVPSPWSARDIGSPTPAGSSTFDQSSGTFTVEAGGSDIWGTSDKFHFVYQQVSGDVDVVARVDSITRADQWSKSGLMIRASLNANSAHAFALVSASTVKGTAFQRRRQSGGASTHTGGPSAMAPYWVRLVRAGTNVTAYVSSNGTSWTSLGSDTIALGTSAVRGNRHDQPQRVVHHDRGGLACHLEQFEQCLGASVGPDRRRCRESGSEGIRVVLERDLHDLGGRH